MEVCGDAENRLASELMQHELQIEKDVLDPLSQLAEVRNLGQRRTRQQSNTSSNISKETFSYLLCLFKITVTTLFFASFGLNHRGERLFDRLFGVLCLAANEMELSSTGHMDSHAMLVSFGNAIL